MPKLSYNKASPYATTPQSSWFLSKLNYRDIPPHGTDVAFQIPKPYVNRPDLAAYSLYGESRFWWIFSVRNPNLIKDPIFDFTEGKVITIPTKDRLRSILL